MRVRDYRELIVWRKAHALSVNIYRQTSNFPAYEQFGLTSQLRRAAVSIPSNIVEGYQRGSNKEFKQFLAIARGSTGEVRAQLEIAKDVGYLKNEAFDDLTTQATEVHKMPNAFIKTLM